MELGENVGLDFVNAVLSLVEDVRDVSYRLTDKVLVFHWSKLNDVLFEFYQQDDKELIQIDEIDKGLRIAKRITAVMEA